MVSEAQFANILPLILGGLVCLIVLGIHIWILWLLQRCFQSIPQEFRLMEPWQVWLMLIPCFNIIWGFFVYPRLSRSFKQLFDAYGEERHATGDCGELLGWLLPSFAIASAIPLLGGFLALADLIILIAYLVKVNGMRKTALQLPAFPDTDRPALAEQPMDSLARPDSQPYNRP